MRECRHNYEERLKFIELVDNEIAQIRAQHAQLLGPRKMKLKVQDAITNGMEIENFTFSVRKNSLFADPSTSSTALIKVGDRFRLGNSPVVYRATKNDGLPTTLEKLSLKIRRTIVAVVLHLEAAKNDALRSDDIDMDMADFKVATQKAEADFKVKTQFRCYFIFLSLN